MSKLSELITAKITNQRGYCLEPYNINMSYDIETKPLDYSTKIKFTAVFGAEYFLPENDKDALVAALNDVRKGIIQEVFGEFRAPLLKIQHLMYKQEYPEANTLLRDIQKQMFDV